MKIDFNWQRFMNVDQTIQRYQIKSSGGGKSFSPSCTSNTAVGAESKRSMFSTSHLNKSQCQKEPH